MKIVKEHINNDVRYGYYDENNFFINHREDGPAVIYADGVQYWYINGELHREDGPAIIHTNGTQEWWINGKIITNIVKQWFKEHNIPNWETMTEEDKFALSFFMRSL